MPPKKGGNNGFYYFFTELRQKHPMRYKNNEEAVAAAGPLWQQMSSEQRHPYDARAKGYKNKEKVRYTSTGQNVAFIQRQQQDEMNKEQQMKESIENSILAAVEAKSLPDKIFYFIHVNYFCICHREYYPAEIALVRWTLADGIVEDNVFSMICKPGGLPVGYSAEAIKISEDTHKIPPPDSNECNLDEIAAKLQDFILMDETNFEPPLFALKRNAPVVTDVIRHLSDRYGMPEYRVFSLEHLFFTLRNSSINGKVWAATSLAQFELERDKYEFCREITCDFHENVDIVSHCSQSIAIRTVYTILDNCCGDMDIELVQGQHVPKGADVSRSRPVSRASSVMSSNTSNAWPQASRRHHQPLQAGYLSSNYETDQSEFSEIETLVDPDERFEDANADSWQVASRRKKLPNMDQGSSQSSSNTQTSRDQLRRPLVLSSALTASSVPQANRGRGRGIGAHYSSNKS